MKENNLSGLRSPSLEGGTRCWRDADPGQALRQAVGAAAREREGAVAAAVFLGGRHQTLLAFTIALGLAEVFAVAAPLAPEAWTLLLAAQVVQGRSSLSGAWNSDKWLHTAVCVCV